MINKISFETLTCKRGTPQMHFWNVFQLICFGGQYIPESKKDINELGLSCDKKFQNFNNLIQFSPNLKGRFVSLALVRKKIIRDVNIFP